MTPVSLSSKGVFRKKNVLLTLGPTREYLDSVRFLSNASSGRMGSQLALRFKSCGAKVFIVAGPGVSCPSGIASRTVVSAIDMLKEVRKKFNQSDIFVSCAAVSDFRPRRKFLKKIHKNNHPLNIPLVPNPDILATVAKKRKKQVCVGFALEDSNGIQNAGKKMLKKNCDLMLLNHPESMESDWIDATLIRRNHRPWKLGRITKSKCADILCRAIAQII